MLKINHKIIIVGVISLAAIEITMILCNHDSAVISTMIVGAISLAIGVILPVPRIDNRRGVLIWPNKMKRMIQI